MSPSFLLFFLSLPNAVHFFFSTKEKNLQLFFCRSENFKKNPCVPRFDFFKMSFASTTNKKTGASAPTMMVQLSHANFVAYARVGT